MILVICGTSSWDFSRLITQMDRIAESSSEEIIIQAVTCKSVPRNARFIGYVSSEEIEQLYSRARIVICHAGTGTVLSALRHRKKPILVPRREEYHEHIDNHQVEFCDAISRAYDFRIVRDISELERIIIEYDEGDGNSSNNSYCRNTLITNLREYLIKQCKD